MRQLELFEGLLPVQTWLHVWNEAERAQRIKNPCTLAVPVQGEPAEAGEGSVEKKEPPK